jgi:tetratricopeptide (TPR) repeat protein
VERRLERRRRDGPPSPYAAALKARAESALQAGRLEEAVDILESADNALDALEPEMALREFPRGLVDYVPQGARGEPPSREEEKESNRLLIASRIAGVRRQEGLASDEAERLLRAAEKAYRDGDRAKARSLVEAALRVLDEEPEAPESPPRKVRTPLESGEAYGGR